MPPSLCVDLDAGERSQLLEIARRSLESGLGSGYALQLDAEQFSEPLRTPSAVFVTLMLAGALRGCIGSLQAVDPLVLAVARSAFNAGFRDHRFGAVSEAEIDRLQIEISVLSEMQPIAADSRSALLDSLEVGVDGLLMEDQAYRSTFLPKVWEKFESPAAFVDQLLLKAGLPAGHWSSSARYFRYHTTSFQENRA